MRHFSIASQWCRLYVSWDSKKHGRRSVITMAKKTAANSEHLIPVKIGTYFNAASLGKKLGYEIGSKDSEARTVQDVFAKAVDFMTDITPDMLKGDVVVSSRPRAVVRRELSRVFDFKTADELAYKPQPGDALETEGVFISASQETDDKLMDIAKKYKLSGGDEASKVFAARLVLSVYARFQKAAKGSDSNEVFIASVKGNSIDESKPTKNLKKYSRIKR